MHLSTVTAALALLACVSGHSPDVAAIRRLAAHSKRTLAQCADSPDAVALRERAVLRRAAWAHALRLDRGLTGQQRRDEENLKKYASLSHDASSAGYTLQTPINTLSGSSATCILVPETIIGPYYVEGEIIRSDVSEGQAGVATFVDIQFIDINTCKAVPDTMIDLWHANATGVYSGVTAPGQGGLETNFGRGAQRTDDDGVVQFRTIFPGHYEGRTAHFHILSSENATLLTNDTFTGGTTTHIGQTYFDQALINDVEATEPYTLNTQPFTTNLEDHYAGDEASNDYDPFMKYTKLGSTITDGVLTWITVGIDLNANYTDKVFPAAKWQEGGGLDESRNQPSDI